MPKHQRELALTGPCQVVDHWRRAWTPKTAGHAGWKAHEVFADTAPKKHVDTRRAEEARVIARAAAVITNSEATANRLTELYGKPERLEVIPNGVMRPDEVDEKDWKNFMRQWICVIHDALDKLRNSISIRSKCPPDILLRPHPIKKHA